MNDEYKNLRCDDTGSEHLYFKIQDIFENYEMDIADRFIRSCYDTIVNDEQYDYDCNAHIAATNGVEVDIYGYTFDSIGGEFKHKSVIVFNLHDEEVADKLAELCALNKFKIEFEDEDI